MKPGITKGGLTFVCVILLLLGLVVSKQIQIANARAKRMTCVNNLKHIGLSFRIYATDHHDRFPMANFATNNYATIDFQKIFGALSEFTLSDPKVVWCRMDRARRPAETMASLTRTNVSYFIGLSADEYRPQSLLAGDRNLQTNGIPLGPGLHEVILQDLGFTGEIHNGAGDVVMGDGSVQQFGSGLSLLNSKDDHNHERLLVP